MTAKNPARRTPAKPKTPRHRDVEAPNRCILYIRRSLGDEALEHSAGRQLHDHLRPLAERLGWTVVAELGVEDRSASRYATRERKQYKQAMTMIDRAEADAIVFYDIDRLLRVPRELEDLIDRVERTGLVTRSINGDLDLTSADGRFIARILVAKAAKEVDDTSRRVKDATRARREKGVPTTGAAFGWVNVTTIDKAEAKYVRQMVERVLGGQSLNGVARWLNSKGVARKRSAKPWGAGEVRSVVTNPRNYGLLVWEGEPTPGSLGRILPAESYGQVLHALAGRSRQARPPRLSLLTGLVLCARCELPLLRNTAGAGREVYTCKRQVNTDRCGAGNIDASILEDAIVATVFEAVDGAELAELVAPESKIDVGAVKAELVRLEATLAEAVEDRKSGALDMAGYNALAAGVTAERERLTGQLLQASRASVLRPYLGQPGALRRGWAKLAIEVKRDVIREALEMDRTRVLIEPYTGTRRGTRFDRDDPAIVEAELARIRQLEVAEPARATRVA
jgi:DNA invertase Pin-like site-specific DNA recombinase